MGNLKERLLGLVDSSVAQAVALADTINDTINDIDWESQFNSLMKTKDAMLKKSSELMSEFSELMKQVKNNLTDFEVIVPFDESLGEKYEYKIEDGKLVVEVTFKDETTERSNRTVVNIPQNCDVEKASAKYNALAKTVTITIPKVIVEPTSETKEEKKKSGYKLRNSTTPRSSEKKVETPEAHQAASKLLKRFKENAASGQRRAANGRFVKRDAATE